MFTQCQSATATSTPPVTPRWPLSRGRCSTPPPGPRVSVALIPLGAAGFIQELHDDILNKDKYIILSCPPLKLEVTGHSEVSCSPHLISPYCFPSHWVGLCCSCMVSQAYDLNRARMSRFHLFHGSCRSRGGQTLASGGRPVPSGGQGSGQRGWLGHTGAV